VRRWVLLLLLGGAWALELPPLPLPPLPPVVPPSPTPPAKEEVLQRFYGQVTLSGGRVPLVGGMPLLGTSPWLSLLAPGMAVEAEGTWGEGGFLVQAVRVVAPDRFAYYRGPGAAVGQEAYPGVELWMVEEGGKVRVFALRAALEGPEVRLVAYWDGRRFLALPPGLAPPSPGLPPGWVEGLGTYRGGRVAWSGFRPFP
jgi:hypothetical protein